MMAGWSWYNGLHSKLSRCNVDSFGTRCDNIISINYWRLEEMVMVVLHYRANGALRDWVCSYDRLEHILEVCEAKGFDVIGWEDL